MARGKTNPLDMILAEGSQADIGEDSGKMELAATGFEFIEGEAASDGGKKKLPRVEMVAYGGGLLQLPGNFGTGIIRHGENRSDEGNRENQG